MIAVRARITLAAGAPWPDGMTVGWWLGDSLHAASIAHVHHVSDITTPWGGLGIVLADHVTAIMYRRHAARELGVVLTWEGHQRGTETATFYHRALRDLVERLAGRAQGTVAWEETP